MGFSKKISPPPPPSQKMEIVVSMWIQITPLLCNYILNNIRNSATQKLKKNRPFSTSEI